MKSDDTPWKRMRFRGKRVWVAVNADGTPQVRDGKVRIKHRLDRDAQYWARTDAVHLIAADRRPDDGAQLPIDFGRPEGRTCAPGTICLFAEGVALGNPGAGGIGVVLRYEEREKCLSAAIGTVTEAAAALEAIGRGLAEIRSRDRPVRVYSSSGYAYGVLALGWKAHRHAARVGAVQRLMALFSDIRVVWPTDHPEAGPTRQAQDLANTAARGDTPSTPAP